MIINVPWSFGDYKKAGINFGLARIPLINQTGLWPGPMVSPLGFSMNASVPRWKVPEVVELMKYLLSPEVQLTFTKQFDTIPTRKDLYDVQRSVIIRLSECRNIRWRSEGRCR
jgi:maltose-binding protein MalE